MQVAHSGEKIAALRERPMDHSRYARRNSLATRFGRIVTYHFQAEHSDDSLVELPALPGIDLTAHFAGVKVWRLLTGKPNEANGARQVQTAHEPGRLN